MTPVRVVCQNTLNLALSSAKRMWSTVHVGDLAHKMDEAHNTLLLAEKYMNGIGGEFERMTRIRLSDGDEELIQILIKLESEFWGLIQSNQPPQLDGSDASAKFLTEQYPVSKPTRIVLPDEAVNLIEQYKEADEKVKQFTEQKQLAENRLKEMLGDCEAGIAGNHSVIWASRGRCRRFSVKETA